MDDFLVQLQRELGVYTSPSTNDHEALEMVVRNLVGRIERLEAEVDRLICNP